MAAELGTSSILRLLHQRQVDVDCCRVQRLSCKIAQQIVLQPNTTFELNWRRCSDKHICIGLDRRIYFENHKVCYFNDGIGGKPHKLYQLHGIRVCAVLLYHTRMLRSPSTPEEKEVCLLTLTRDGFLKVLNANTGAVLRSIFISTAITFRYLEWANYLHTVLVKSTQNTTNNTTSRTSARGVLPSLTSRLMVVALFRIHPLELIACMAIERDIFGADTRDASVNEDILVVSHKNGMYRMYSLHWIMEHCTIVNTKLDQMVEIEGRMGSVGSPGFGVPLTIKLTECPPLLFECKSGSDCGISFGGSPTVYLHNPTPKQPSVFCVKSLRTQKMIAKLSTDTLVCHHDVAEFHFEDYQRVLHISGCTLNCFYILYENGEPHDLARQYLTDFKKLIRRNEQPLRTSSGRIVKRRCCTENELTDHISAIQDVDYENELDLLYVVVTLPDGTEGTQAIVCFLDDKTGQITKKIPIPTWNPDASNTIYYELDCIIHLLQDRGHSTCSFYQLNRTLTST